MTGSLQIKDNKYYVVLNLHENGKRKQKWISTKLDAKNNKRKAEQFLRDTLKEYENKSLYSCTDITLADYIRLWLNHIKRKVDEITYQGYFSLADKHILPYFDKSGLLLQDVSCDDIQAYFDEKALHGRLDGKGGLSSRSLRLHKNIIYQACKLAQRNNLIPNNPCEFLDLPNTERYESLFYSAEQLQSLFNAIINDELCPLVKITVLYGLRRSEVLGLKWDSIDFDRNILTIKHTVVKVTDTIVKDKTKNATSYRSFPLIPEARNIFLKAKEDEAQYRQLAGKGYIENDYVFKWPDGHPFSPDYVSKHFCKLLSKNQLPHIRFHELRHSCASLLLNQGYSLKDVQEWLGHADIKMTANIYGHLDVQRKQNMAHQLAHALS